ncbi:MAG: YeeE/YedE family protein [Promethearchaeia archaeon]
MEFWYALIGGLIVGAVFGFLLQRGRFCMNSAFRDIILLKEYKLAKAVLVSLAVLMVGFAIFALSGVIDLSPKPFKPFAAIVGGLIFGVGMVLAAGCASGTTYRVGEGMTGSFVAAIGLTGGALMTAGGIFTSTKNALQSITIGSQLTVFGEFSALTPIFMLIIGIIAIVIMFVFWSWPAIKRKKESGEPLIKPENFVESAFKKGHPWWLAGILIGIILTIGFIVSNGVVGITGGWMNISGWLTSTGTLGWTGAIIIGAVIGALISAVIAKEFKLRIPNEGLTLVKQFVGGILMGFGAVTALGCNITNILGGVPQLSLHSILAGACIVFGCWIAAYFMFMWRED